jgi:hypothetical protein
MDFADKQSRWWSTSLTLTVFHIKSPGKMFVVNVLNRIAMGDDSHVLSDNRRILSEFIDVPAQLSCVDGALIIDDELKPHRFRCHLAAEKWDGRVLEGTWANPSTACPLLPVNRCYPAVSVLIFFFFYRPAPTGHRHNMLCRCPVGAIFQGFNNFPYFA